MYIGDISTSRYLVKSNLITGFNKITLPLRLESPVTNICLIVRQTFLYRSVVHPSDIFYF